MQRKCTINISSNTVKVIKKKPWNLISEVMGYQKKSVSIPELLVNDELCSGSLEIPNAANEYFAKVEENLGSNFPDSDNLLTYLGTSAEHSLTFDKIRWSSFRLSSIP